VTWVDLPVETLTVGHREHVAAHQQIHAWLNEHHDDGGGGGGGGGTSRVLASWVYDGTVRPAFTTLEPIDDDTHVAAVELTVLRKPFIARHMVVDVLLDGVSLWANPDDRPSFLPNQANPYVVTLAPHVAASAGQLLQGVWLDGGGAADCRFKVLSA